MHAWESIQKSVDYIEENLGTDIQIEELAELASLSLFYFQRLFARLVKRPVREYIKLRRLACACERLEYTTERILDIALDYGFNSHVTFTKAFKDVYGITPSEYRIKPVSLNNFDKPNLSLNYVMIDEGVPLISEGIVLEYNHRTLDEPVHFLGVQDFWRFNAGKMLGERPEVSGPGAVWENFFNIYNEIPRIPNGRRVGVSFHGGAPDGYSTYFAGAEVDKTVMESADIRFARWQLPAREYIVCEYQAENSQQLMASLGKMMKFTRFWLKEHGLTADGFFPELYYSKLPDVDYAHMEMWMPFKKREKK